MPEARNVGVERAWAPPRRGAQQGFFNLEWLNPATCKVGPGQIPGGISVGLISPFAGDAVLYLRRINQA